MIKSKCKGVDTHTIFFDANTIIMHYSVVRYNCNTQVVMQALKNVVGVSTPKMQ
jgi:hypothetical protein